MRQQKSDAPQAASAPSDVSAYLDSLPEDRRQAIAAVRQIILEHLPEGYEETCAFGMLSYQVPLSSYPDTYNKKPLMYAALGSQKGHMALYLCNVYALPALREEFVAGFAAAGKRLDMGKSCVRFKRLADLPLPVIASAIGATRMADFIEHARSQQTATARAARKEARTHA